MKVCERFIFDRVHLQTVRRPASKAPVLRVNNNKDNFSIDVLYFVPEKLKKVQESC